MILEYRYFWNFIFFFKSVIFLWSIFDSCSNKIIAFQFLNPIKCQFSELRCRPMTLFRCHFYSNRNIHSLPFRVCVQLIHFDLLQLSYTHWASEFCLYACLVFLYVCIFLYQREEMGPTWIGLWLCVLLLCVVLHFEDEPNKWSKSFVSKKGLFSPTSWK